MHSRTVFCLVVRFRCRGRQLWRPLFRPALAVSPLLPLTLPAPVASTEQTLWLAAGLYALLAAADPRSGTALKVYEILAASLLCSLALVDTGVQGGQP